MSFLAGRVAGSEGAYFLQESKHAVGRILERSKPKLPSSSSLPTTPLSNTQSIEKETDRADVLPEVLRHSLPPKILQPYASNSSSVYSSAKWGLHSDTKPASSVSPDDLNPLRAYVSLPQVTFGPKRWQFPNQENTILCSTANELRQDKYTHVNPEKLKAAAIGLTQIAKAFGIATAIVFGGATVTFGMAASKLELRKIDDIQTKGKDLVQPKLQMVREKMTPLRTWAEDRSKKWHVERDQDIKERPLIRELSKNLGVKTSS